MPLSFTLNGASFTLTNECLEQMAETLRKTKVRERGFKFCGGPQALTPGRAHIGGPYSIHTRNCSGKPAYGGFHTHPINDSEPSSTDVLHILWGTWSSGKPWLGCRGGIDQKIRCETATRIPTAKDYIRLKHAAPKERMTWLSAPHIFSVKDVPELIKPPVIIKPPEIKLWQRAIEMDKLHSLEELRGMCQQKGLSTSGDKKKLAMSLLT